MEAVASAMGQMASIGQALVQTPKKDEDNSVTTLAKLLSGKKDEESTPLKGTKAGKAMRKLGLPFALGAALFLSLQAPRWMAYHTVVA